MKKYLLLLWVMSIPVFAQITITSGDFANMFDVGNEITIRENEGGGSVNIGQLGGDNIWDFSFFQGNLQLDMVSIDPATSPFINEFPNANFAFYSVGDFEGDQGELWNHSSVNGSFDNFGYGAVISSQPLDTLTVINDPARIEAELPLTFNSSWSHSYTQTLYINGVPFISSQVNFSAVVDAYGTMIFPGGESFEALRMKQTMTINGTASVTYQFLSKEGAQVGVFAANTNPPDTGFIATDGYSWNFDFSGGGNLDLTVTHPGSDDIVIAGELDSITYIFYEGDVDLYYSLDEGQNFVLIDSNYNTFGGVYYWDVPDSLLTTKAKIKIVDSSIDSAESGVFKIKPWQLTRLDDNKDFELYQPDQDGWNFCNCTVNMWPQSWWQQFNYQTGTDPYTGLRYPPYFYTTSSIAFPDWPLYVDVFSEPRCYMPTPVGKMYRTRPLFYWIATVNPWGGSCAGFSVSSLIGFYHKPDLIQYIGNFDELYSENINESTRYVNNFFQTHQKGKEARNHRRASLNTTPRELLAQLKEMLGSDNLDARPLDYFNNNRSGGHAVVPYKLDRIGNTSTFNIKLYNSNVPGSFNQFIYIDSVANTWSDSTGFNWGTGSSACFLERESADFLLTPSLNRPTNLTSPTSDNSGSSRLVIYNTLYAEMVITSSTGEQIGYQDSITFNNMSDALPIIPLTGYFHPPIGYDLPEDSYTLEMNNFTDSSSKVLFDEEFTMYDYSRYNVNNNETDLFRYSENGVKTINPDAETKNIDLITIIPEDTISEKVFFANNLEMQTGDSINIKEKDRNELVINNFGSTKSYELRIINLSKNGQFVFENSLVPLSQNSGHQIIPDWNDLQLPVKILIDLGNDGTIDDSIFIKNQATNIEGEGSLISPDSYNLAQNFPNPFNPTTSIRYSIPQRSHVTLKVFDILGNEVASLVNEEKERGVYTVTFNAAALASGIYFYTLRSDGFVQTKKMLLLR